MENNATQIKYENLNVPTKPETTLFNAVTHGVLCVGQESGFRTWVTRTTDSCYMMFVSKDNVFAALTSDNLKDLLEVRWPNRSAQVDEIVAGLLATTVPMDDSMLQQ